MSLLPEIKSFLHSEDREAAQELRTINGESVYALEKPENKEIKAQLLTAMRENISHILNRNGRHPNIHDGGDNIADNPLLKAAIESIGEVMCIYLYELQLASNQDRRKLKYNIGADQVYFREFAIGYMSQNDHGGWQNACHRLNISYPPSQSNQIEVQRKSLNAAEDITKSLIGACISAFAKAVPGGYAGWPGKGFHGELGVQCCVDP